jgi:uncharacterized protein (TIGR00369 family)
VNNRRVGADGGVAMEEAERIRIAQSFVDRLPHCRELGMRVVGFDTGAVAITMPYDPRFVGDPETGVIHGGAVSALMDSCAGAAVHSISDDIVATATLDLRIDYMRSATPGEAITARAEVYHATRTVAFLRAVATDEDTKRPVATATGAFTVERKS